MVFSVGRINSIRDLWRSALWEYDINGVKGDIPRFCKDFAEMYGLELVLSGKLANFYYKREYGKSAILRIEWGIGDTPDLPSITKWNDDFAEKLVSMVDYRASKLAASSSPAPVSVPTPAPADVSAIISGDQPIP